MAKISLSFLTAREIQDIHDTSMQILANIGLRVTSHEVRELMQGHPGVEVKEEQEVITFQESAVWEAIKLAPARFSVYGRDRSTKITYGEEGFVSQAIPGESHWVDPEAVVRRDGTMEDFEKAVVVADALPNIDIVGAMIQPVDVPIEIREIYLYAELLKRTRKPVRSWVFDRRAAGYILELFKVMEDGDDLREYPPVEFGFEPISPLILPGGPLETALVFAREGIPITLGPMPQAMATAPVTLAGAIAQGNAEALGALVIVQAAAPGTPVIYYSAPHIMDPRTMSLVFSSPEQGLMGVAVTEIGKHYGLPVGINVGLTDAKVPDAQSGLEKGLTMVMGALAGADIFGAMGISGCDQGFSLPQLIIDDEIISFVKRILKGVQVSPKTLAYEVIERVGIGETFLMEDHTLDHWRDELWITRLCDRDAWDPWFDNGQKSMLDRAVDKQQQILAEHTLEWLDEGRQKQLDRIVAVARNEILGA